MESKLTFHVIRQGTEPGKGDYLSDQDGFVRDFEVALRMGKAEAQETLRVSYLIQDSGKPARVVKVDTTWIEEEIA